MTSRAEDLLNARLDLMQNTLTQISITLEGMYRAQLACLKEEEWNVLKRANAKETADRHIEKLHRDIDQFTNQDN